MKQQENKKLKGTPLPSSGHLDKVYLNTTLNKDDILSLTHTLFNLLPDDGYGEKTYVITAVQTVNDEMIPLALIQTVQTGRVVIGVIDPSTGEPRLFFDSDVNDQISDEYVLLGGEIVSMYAGPYNGLLTSIVSNDPFIEMTSADNFCDISDSIRKRGESHEPIIPLQMPFLIEQLPSKGYIVPDTQAITGHELVLDQTSPSGYFYSGNAGHLKNIGIFVIANLGSFTAAIPAFVSDMSWYWTYFDKAKLPAYAIMPPFYGDLCRFGMLANILQTQPKYIPAVQDIIALTPYDCDPNKRNSMVILESEFNEYQSEARIKETFDIPQHTITLKYNEYDLATGSQVSSTEVFVLSFKTIFTSDMGSYTVCLDTSSKPTLSKSSQEIVQTLLANKPQPGRKGEYEIDTTLKYVG